MARLNDSMIHGTDGRFKAVTWRDALAVVAEVLQQVKPEEITGVAGKLSDAESMITLKDFVNKMSSDKVLCEGNGPNPPVDLRSNYLMNTTIAGLEKADVFLLVGTQLRVEASMVNARIRKTVRATQAKVAYIGPQLISTMTMSILAQDDEPLLRLRRVTIHSVQLCSLLRILSSLLGLGYLNGKTKMPFSQQ